MNGVEQPGELKERNGLENEVLVALFDAPKRHDKVRRRASNAVKRYAAWEVVDGPPTDLDIDQKKIVTYLEKDNDEGMYSVFWEHVLSYSCYRTCRKNGMLRSRRKLKELVLDILTELHDCSLLLVSFPLNLVLGDLANNFDIMWADPSMLH